MNLAQLFANLAEIETASAYITLMAFLLLGVLPLLFPVCWKRTVTRVLWGLLGITVVIFLLFKPIVFDGVIEQEQEHALQQALSYDTMASSETNIGAITVTNQGDHKDLILELYGTDEPVLTQIAWGAASILPPHGPYGRYYYHVKQDDSGLHFTSYRPIRKEISDD